MCARDVLALDMAGIPREWLDVGDAISYYAKGMVAWALGENVSTYRGGIARASGRRTEITAQSIIAIRGQAFSIDFDAVPRLTNDKLFARDRNVCAYCGLVFQDRLLSRDHVHPVSRDGLDVWENVVTACKTCNGRKDNLRPEEAGMPLLFVPFVPNYFEDFILANRSIRADQMEFLLSMVPRHSRLLM